MTEHQNQQVESIQPAAVQPAQKDFWTNFLLFFLMLAWSVLLISTWKLIFLIPIVITLFIYAIRYVIRYWYRSVPATFIMVRSWYFGEKVGRAMLEIPYIQKVVKIPTKKFEIIIEFGEKKFDEKPTEKPTMGNGEACGLPAYQAKDTLVSGRVQAYVGVNTKNKYAVIRAAEGLGELLQQPPDEVDRFFQEMLQAAVKSALDESTLKEIHEPKTIQDRIKVYMVNACATIGFSVDSINPVRLQQTRLSLLPKPLGTGQHEDVYIARTFQKVAAESSKKDRLRFEALKKAKTKLAQTEKEIADEQSKQFVARQATAKEEAGVSVASQVELARGEAEQVIQNARGRVESGRLNQVMEAQMESFRRVTLAASEKEVMEHVTEAANFLKKSGVISDQEINEIVQARITWEYTKMFPDGATRDAILKSMGMDVDKIRALASPLEKANINIIGGPELAESVAKIPAFARGAEMAVEQIPILQKLLSSAADMVSAREGKLTSEK